MNHYDVWQALGVRKEVAHEEFVDYRRIFKFALYIDSKVVRPLEYENNHMQQVLR